MEHLSPETLARLVDGTPGEEEEAHLRSCSRCRAELKGLRKQTEALGELGDLEPPPEAWGRLSDRLREEGLVRDAGSSRAEATARMKGTGRGEGTPEEVAGSRLRALPFLRSTPSSWLQAAAALALFLGGAAAGVGLIHFAPDGVPDGQDRPGFASTQREAAPERWTEASTLETEGLTLEEAARQVQDAEERYVASLLRYRAVLEGEEESGGSLDDPAARYAAVETLVAASRAAVRQSPTDPFLNGMLVNALTERHALLRTISTPEPGRWF